VIVLAGRGRARYGYGTSFGGLRMCVPADCEQKKQRKKQSVFHKRRIDYEFCNTSGKRKNKRCSK
jgi:hypothetical protein